MNPDIDADGLVRWRDGDGTERRWASLAELAADWWRYQRQSESEKDADPMIAWECVLEFGGSGDPPHPRVTDVIQSLVDAADNDDELNQVGVGPLETLLSHSGHGELLIDEVELRARQQPRFRTALHGVWLGKDVRHDVRLRLARLGASDLTDAPHQQP